jgi:hypothetical protein
LDEAFPQTPPLQNPPQHSLFNLQVLPSVLHVGVHGAGVQLIAWQMPPPFPSGTHEPPPQQSADVPHAPLLSTHFPQRPPMHAPKQHLVGSGGHAEPVGVQELIGVPQTLPPPSLAVQLPVQHSALVAQVVPVAVQESASPSRPPSRIASMNDASSGGGGGGFGFGFGLLSSPASSVALTSVESLPQATKTFTIAVAEIKMSAAQGSFRIDPPRR